MASSTNCSSCFSSIEGKQFDFVIVGGGTAGLVLARRLSEDPNAQVLVVEAGENRLDDQMILTPGMAASLYDKPEYDWGYISEPQVRRTISPMSLGGYTSVYPFRPSLFINEPTIEI